MSITRLDPNPRLSAAVVHGDTVYVAGQVALATKGGSVTDQTREILAMIDSLLARAGTDKSKILSASCWLTDIGTIGEMNAVWEAWIPQGETPARATVEARLASPDYKVEIACIAAR